MVCRAAARALGTIGSREAVPELLALLADRERDVQGAAAFALGKLAAKDAAPDLLRALEKPGRHDARVEVAEALGELGAKEALPALLRLLEDKDFQGQADLLPVVVRLGGGAASPQIMACFKHESADVRAAAIRAARALQVKGLAPALAGLLEDSSDEVWQEAAEAIAETGAAEIAPQLQALAANEGARDLCRRAALLVLGRGGVKAAVPFLRERLRDEKTAPAFAVCAAYALAELGASESAEELLRLLASKDDDVQAAAATALGRLGAQEAAGGLRGILEGKSYAGRCAAARALAALGDRGAVPLLRKAAEGDDFPGVAALALAELGDRESVPAMLRALESDDDDARRDAADALARVDPRAAEVRLKASLGSPDRTARRNAAQGLCRLGTREGVPALLEAARGDARCSLFALNAVRSPAAWKKLLDRKVASVLPGGSLGTARLLRLTARVEVDSEEEGSSWWMFGSEVEQGWRSALHALEEYEDSAVLEGDRVRSLPRHKELRFWQDWWRAQSKDK
jgi:HEAT repeat protein